MIIEQFGKAVQILVSEREESRDHPRFEVYIRLKDGWCRYLGNGEMRFVPIGKVISDRISRKCTVECIDNMNPTLFFYYYEMEEGMMVRVDYTSSPICDNPFIDMETFYEEIGRI